MKKDIGFKYFLLNEDKVYLGQKIGDILNALQELVENGKAIGARQLVKNSEAIVNQIRRILHSEWQKEDEKYLKSLQKIGVSIMRAIDEKDDLNSILAGASSALEKVQGDLGTPINSLSTPEGKEEPVPDESMGVAKSQGKADQQQQPPQPASPQQSAPQPGMQMPQQQPPQPGMQMPPMPGM